jgi:hypothetical protein
MGVEQSNWREQLRKIGKNMASEKEDDTQGKSIKEESLEKEEQVQGRIVEEQNTVRQGLKHVNLSDQWRWSEDPFPAFRCSIVFGRNKRDKSFLPVKDIQPEREYTVEASSSDKKLYQGGSEEKAKKHQLEYNEHMKAGHYYARAHYSVSLPVLPQGRFRIIKTKAKGTIMVVPGLETSDRCLLFVGCKGGMRGGVSLVEMSTSSQVLKKCQARSACYSQVELVALMSKGETVVFHSYGRYNNHFVEYTWDGQDIKKVLYPKAEWELRRSMEAPDVEGDFL